MDATALQFMLVACIVVVMGVNIGMLTDIPRRLQKEYKRLQDEIKKNENMPDTKLLPPADVEEINKQIKSAMAEVGKRAAQRLQESLNNTVDRIASSIDEETSTQLSQEFEKYQVSLQALRDQSIVEFGKLQKELDKRRNELLEKLNADIAEEYASRVDAFNARINDVVASYLIETLGQNVDLGAQSDYIFATLQQHKDDIKRDILA